MRHITLGLVCTCVDIYLARARARSFVTSPLAVAYIWACDHPVIPTLLKSQLTPPFAVGCVVPPAASRCPAPDAKECVETGPDPTKIREVLSTWAIFFFFYYIVFLLNLGYIFLRCSQLGLYFYHVLRVFQRRAAPHVRTNVVFSVPLSVAC